MYILVYINILKSNYFIIFIFIKSSNIENILTMKKVELRYVQYLPYTMKVLRQKSFTVLSFLRVRETFLYESSRWCCSNVDLRESMWDSVKVFLQKSACTTCHKTFLPQNFHGIWYMTIGSHDT